MTRNKYGIFSDCLHGDVAKAIKDGRRNSRYLDVPGRRQLDQLIRRFSGGSDITPVRVDDRLIKDLVMSYRRYYQAVLMGRVQRSVAEKSLFAELCDVLNTHGISTPGIRSFKNLESKLKTVCRERGYYSLVGKIHPFQSLSLWKHEVQRTHKTRLPETTITVSVRYIDKLIEHGWMSYATLGKFYPGGWVPDDAKDQIFCVMKAYRRREEALRVSLLGHEAQHVADLRAFPKIQPVDLEYRAKLTELVMSKRPAALLKKFGYQAVNDKKSPHGFASWSLISHFTDEKGAEISRRASALLAEHSEQLRAAGSQKVRSVLT